MALRFTKNYLSIYFILFILMLIFVFLFQSTFIDFYNENEKITSNKINNDIEIYRNKFGFTKVKIGTIEDYYFALGFSQSYDRFLQLELLRKLAKGEISTFLKEDKYVLDKVIRDIDLQSRAKFNYLQNYNSPIHHYIQNYVNGINFFISNYYNKLPLEFGLINYDIQNFDIEDIYLIDELYDLMYDNNLKLNIFSLISSIKLGVNKSKKLFSQMGIYLNEDMLKTISSRKYTYGELKYLHELYNIINFLNYGVPINFDSPYFINSNGEIIFSYNHYSKTFLNFSPYYSEYYVAQDTISGFFRVGSPFPQIIRKNELIYSELNNNLKSNYISLYDISENKLKYKKLEETNFIEFEIGIDTINLGDKSKLEYFYKTKENEKIINFSQESFSLGLAIGTNKSMNSNKFEFLHNLLYFNKYEDYKGNNISFLFLKDTIRYFTSIGSYLNNYDSINIFNQKPIFINKKEVINDIFFNKTNYYSPFNQRLEELLSDDHKFNLTDIRLINNDNKNVLAETYFYNILKNIKVNNQNKNEAKFLELLLKWDYIEEKNKIETDFFYNFNLNLIELYLKKYYDLELFKYIIEIPYLKLMFLKSLFDRLDEEEIISFINLSWNKTIEKYDLIKDNYELIESKYKIEHILTYFNNKELINLPLDNFKGSEYSINFFHNFANYLVTNNSSIIFKLNNNKNYVIQNSGQSARLESEWNKNLFKIWTTGGLVESKLNFDNDNKIIHIKSK